MPFSKIKKRPQARSDYCFLVESSRQRNILQCSWDATCVYLFCTIVPYTSHHHRHHQYLRRGIFLFTKEIYFRQFFVDRFLLNGVRPVGKGIHDPHTRHTRIRSFLQANTAPYSALLSGLTTTTNIEGLKGRAIEVAREHSKMGLVHPPLFRRRTTVAAGGLGDLVSGPFWKLDLNWERQVMKV